MIAGRRDRRRSLIRPKVMVAAMARSLSPRNGVAAYQSGSSEFDRTAPVTPSPISASQPELAMYLRQLSALHRARILTDDEFTAAMGRLLGS